MRGMTPKEHPFFCGNMKPKETSMLNQESFNVINRDKEYMSAHDMRSSDEMYRILELEVTINKI